MENKVDNLEFLKDIVETLNKDKDEEEKKIALDLLLFGLIMD